MVFKYALRMKMTSSVPSKDHWLDNAKGQNTESEISDTRSVLDVICVFSAYPVFWSLSELMVWYNIYLFIYIFIHINGLKFYNIL